MFRKLGLFSSSGEDLETTTLLETDPVSETLFFVCVFLLYQDKGKSSKTH
jgi:hypothetical protein